MAGAQYIALSGMRSRLDELDRVAADIANAATAGYKAERTTDRQADRPRFDAALQTAIDVAPGGRRLDASAGPLSATGRDLDFALEGPGFFTVQTPGGLRYTRNGHFTVATDGTLTTAEGHPVAGVEGPIKVGTGRISVDQDGTLHAGTSVAGRFALAQFADTSRMARESGALLRTDATPSPAPNTSVKGGTLEASNVSVVHRIAELTSVSRTFQALQKALLVVMNDVDARAVDSLGRRG
jgi:flagellar basal body rod protein FlgG